MRKAQMSFEQKRKVMAKALSKGRCAKSKVIPFRNEDVPSFLKELKAFQRESRKSELVAM